MNGRCERCKFFLDLTNKHATYGICRRWAPIAVPSMAANRNLVEPPHADKFYASEAEWPRVHPQWVCGEYQPRLSQEELYRRAYEAQGKAVRDLILKLKGAERRVTNRDTKLKDLKGEVRHLEAALRRRNQRKE